MCLTVYRTPVALMIADLAGQASVQLKMVRQRHARDDRSTMLRLYEGENTTRTQIVDGTY